MAAKDDKIVQLTRQLETLAMFSTQLKSQLEQAKLEAVTERERGRI